MAINTLRLILGDQLNSKHSWFKTADKGVLYVLMEMRQETDYAPHHIQKVVGFFAAMREFAKCLEQDGHNVLYLKLSDEHNSQSLEENISKIISEKSIKCFEYQEPDEWRLEKQLKDYCSALEIKTDMVSTEHFFTQRNDLKSFFEGKKTYLMESFYRSMRKKHSILMQGKNPVGEKWNYDAENRNKLPDDDVPPSPKLFSQDVSALVSMLEEADVKTIGSIEKEAFYWPTNRKQALELFKWFLENCLPHFGKYQDALTTNYWSLYHSRISFALNTKMIGPKEVCRQAEAYWREHQDTISLPQIEGFIRQILGWREFMRGVYWAQMPEYANQNYFEHKQDLPDWFWTGKTKMKCVSHSINQSLKYAYAHHIQRLMVTGNFVLLAGIHPDAVDNWYLGIYIDAIEWVEITNTRGMSQFADGGLVATKPYVSSANYINKMGNYCKNCAYNASKKTGENACPFNSLYWHFFNRNEEKLAMNPRIGMAYRTWGKMKPENKEALLKQAEYYLENIENL